MSFSNVKAAKGSCADLFPVTPNDAADVVVGHSMTKLVIETAGTLVLVMVSGQTRTFPSGFFATGVVHEVAFKRVMATGTTAVVWAGY